MLLLQAELSDGRVNHPVRIGVQAMLLDQHVEGRQDEPRARPKVVGLSLGVALVEDESAEVEEKSGEVRRQGRFVHNSPANARARILSINSSNSFSSPAYVSIEKDRI